MVNKPSLILRFTSHPALRLFLFIVLLGFFFAKVEIQIEGGQGWAKGLPTWRIERHWLLDIFWGGRAMTGYHAWVFSFMFLVFHLHFFFAATWSLCQEAKVIGALMWFWIIEDFLWFILNPAYGWAKFAPKDVPWHKKWLGSLPQDYWVFAITGTILVGFAYYMEKRPGKFTKS